MKRLATAVGTAALVFGGAATALAATIGPPEIDKAQATIQAKPTATFGVTRCAGEDGIPYETLTGAWVGGENDSTPGSTDYNLSGNWSVSGIVWTINLKTDRGVLRGTAKLTNASPAGATSVTYAGPLTLVTQGAPGAANGVEARGWLVGSTFTKGTADGGSILANVEFDILPGNNTNGEFGTSMSYNDFSVADNNMVC